MQVSHDTQTEVEKCLLRRETDTPRCLPSNRDRAAYDTLARREGAFTGDIKIGDLVRVFYERCWTLPLRVRGIDNRPYLPPRKRKVLQAQQPNHPDISKLVAWFTVRVPCKPNPKRQSAKPLFMKAFPRFLVTSVDEDDDPAVAVAVAVN